MKWLFLSAGLVFWALGLWGIVWVNRAWPYAPLIFGLLLMAGAADLDRLKNPGRRILRDLTINILLWVVIVLVLLALFSRFLPSRQGVSQ